MDLLSLQPLKMNTSVTSKIFLFYGPAKSWKTTVASKFPGALIAATEKGYQMIHEAYVRPITNWNDFKDFCMELARPEVRKKFQTIVIDTASNLYHMAERFVSRIKGIRYDEQAYGKGYSRAKEEFVDHCEDILSLGYGIVFICHAEEREENGSIQIRPLLDKRAKEYITGLADFIFYTRKEEDEDGKMKSFAYSRLGSALCGGRGDEFLPDRFLFTYPELVKQIETAIEKQVQSLGYETIEDYGSTTKDSDFYATTQVSLEDLKKEIYALLEFDATDYIFEQVGAQITDLFGTRKISEAEEIDREKLVSIKEYLVKLRRELGIE